MSFSVACVSNNLIRPRWATLVRCGKRTEALGVGVVVVVTLDNRDSAAGRLDCDRGRAPKPAVVRGRPVLFVEVCGDGWRALRRD
ncbi:MAG: hypothetical protein ABFC38_10240 [Methanospirillum sp.]